MSENHKDLTKLSSNNKPLASGSLNNEGSIDKDHSKSLASTPLESPALSELSTPNSTSTSSKSLDLEPQVEPDEHHLSPINHDATSDQAITITDKTDQESCKQLALNDQSSQESQEVSEAKTTSSQESHKRVEVKACYNKSADKDEVNKQKSNKDQAKSKPPKIKKSLGHRIRNFVAVLCLGILISLGALYGLVHACAPDLSKFYDRSHSLYDKSGNLIYSAMNKGGYHRILTTQAQVDPLYIKMLLASEDERFYSHSGVDVIAISRALWSNITSGSVVSGASTIAMQVCRMLEPKERNLWSKFKEALGALYLTHYYGKDQVLSLYLTLAPFGGNIEGVTAASYIYFKHSPKDLTPAEAALLVALPRSPEVIRPDRNPKSARYYRNEVLKKAVTDKLIKPDILSFATNEPIPTRRYPLPQDAYYLGQSIFTSKLITPEIKALKELTARIINHKDVVTVNHNSDTKVESKNSDHEETIDEVLDVQLSGASIKVEQSEAFDKATSQDNLYIENKQEYRNLEKGKLEYREKLKELNALGPLPRELYTTIDPKVQEILMTVVKDYREHFLSSDNQDSLGILVVDNENFEVLGYCGALGSDISYVDSILALRSPGSALKPFAYALAFEKGLLHPNSILLDNSQIYHGYQPRNYDRRFYGELTASKALQASLNLPAVEIMRAIGPDNFVNLLNSAHNAFDLYNHSGELDSYTHGALVLPKAAQPSLSLVLGGCGISLFDLTHLYAALAHDGSSAPLRVLSSKRPSSSLVRKYNYRYALKERLKPNEVSAVAKSTGNKENYYTKKSDHVHYQTLLSPAAARATYNILQGTPAPFGYGNDYFSLGPKVSYKTGTSYKHRDAWAIGSSNNITVGVWTGRNDGSPSYNRTGFNHAAPLLFKVITKLTSNDMRKKRIADDVLLHARPPMALSKVHIRDLGLVTKKEDGFKNYEPLLANQDSSSSQSATRDVNLGSIMPLNIAFPSDGTRLSLGSSQKVLIKFSGGKGPYYVLINDELNNELESFTPHSNGFYTITVIDSLGNSASSQVLIEGVEH